ncbi:unnamed protein product [Adineta steineri]|uniref:G-protein coupled receptors family 1 profile domain-containing protein n=1 Tax=Adineta steineri TaxID=433720 RepID=A0A818RQV9_9BILA|nr:unnamed protein product [Adineta steineri]
MTSSADTDFSAYYDRLRYNISVISGFTCLGLGFMGNIMSCMVFGEKTMRQNPGSIYFIAYSVVNFLSLLFGLLTNMLYDYNLDPSSYNIPYCKIHYYLQIIFIVMGDFYLLLISIDRVLITSSKATLRQRSNHRTAYRSIGGVTLIILLFHIHLFVGVGIYEIYPGFNYCYLHPGDYRIFDAITNIVLEIIPLIFLSIFGMWTWKNLSRIRVQPATIALTATNTHRSKDRQLTIIFLAEIVIYMLFNTGTCFFGIYEQITQYQTKSVRQQAIEEFLIGFFYTITFIAPSISFYLYLAVSKSFRKKALQVLFKRGQH